MFLREEKEEEQDSGRDEPGAQWGKPPPAHVLKQLPGWHESQN